MIPMKTGVIDVGGGLRGVYAAGVFDRCLEDGAVIAGFVDR